MNVPRIERRNVDDDERHVPLPQHASLLLDHDRVEKRRAREPREQRRVLDRIPRPVAAPPELDVGPPHAERDADREEEPAQQRPAPHRRQPLRVEAARDEGSDRVGERNRRRDIAEVEHRRVDRHPRVLELRVHAAPVGWDPVEALERIRAEAHREQEEERDRTQRPGHVRHEMPRLLTAPGVDGGSGVEGEDQTPEQHRARLTGPERRERVDRREVRAGVARDELDREIVREQRRPQPDARDDDESGRGVERALAAPNEIGAGARGAGERDGDAPRCHEQRDPERQLADQDEARREA